MPLQCPACSKVNPADAAYCYYDGRGLAAGSPPQPVGLGTAPFPLPFCFPDGQSCANFNQLALACDERWNEARGLLTQGIWQSYFSSIGRLDLAAAARQAAAEPDLDVGLTHLLQSFPTAADALRPPELAVASTEEDLGTLEPGKDHKFELRLSNKGMLVLRGMVMTDCDWLSFGERGAGASLKMFQTRNVYTLPVRILGNKLRAGQKALEGQIVIDSNGGTITVPIRARVPVRPFPNGQQAKNVLAGARSPRELAVKARANLKEAGELFEQGAVKAWYASNGWTYPIQGTEGTGKGAVQQFFEALGLTKAPRLEIDTGQIACKGKVGQRITRHVKVSTAESRPVYAHAWSNEQWIKPGPARARGNAVTIPLSIEVPPRPGEQLQAAVKFEGNGKQQFVVPVTLTVAVASAEEDEPEEPGRRVPLTWIAVAAVLLLAIVGSVALLVMMRPTDDGPSDQGTVAVVIPPPVPQNDAWWDRFPDSKLAALAAGVKESVPAATLMIPPKGSRFVIDALAVNADVERYKAYEQLHARLPELLRDARAREPLRRFLSACCVWEPSDLNIGPLRRGLADLLPRDGVAFRPEENGAELERALFALDVVTDALANKVIRPERAHNLANDLGAAFLSLNTAAPPGQLKAQAEKALAERCYRNTLPTAARSMDLALRIRGILLQKFAKDLVPTFRDNVDMGLVVAGLSRGEGAWPKLAPLLKGCLQSDQSSIAWRVAGLYEQANPDLAQKMDDVLAARWKVVANPKLTHADKVAALRKILVTPQISPAERLAHLQKLTTSTLAAIKPGEKKESVLLQDTVRLAHASTMACLLLREGADGERFDELIARVPSIQQTEEPAELAKGGEKQPSPKAKQPDLKGAIVLGPRPKVITGRLTKTSDRDPGRPGSFCKVYRVFLKGGQVYTIDLISRAFDSYLRLEDPNGLHLMEDDDGGGYPNARIVYSVPTDGVYRIVATTFNPGAVGPYTLQIQQAAGALAPQFGVPGFGFPPPRIGFPRVNFVGRPPIFIPPLGKGPPFGPGMLPPNQPAPEMPEKKESPINESDLTDLRSPQSKVRLAAFSNLAANLPDEVPAPAARKIAEYLLGRAGQQSELEDVSARLEPFARCRTVVLALADCLAKEDKATQLTTETIVGGVLGQPLRFARDEDWRSACRKLLLQRALDLTGNAQSGADQAEAILRDLYREQGLAFGLEDKEFLALPGPTQVLERLIQHVAARAVKGAAAGADRTYLEQIDRQLEVARYVAANDLEHMVLLQPQWLKVLALYLGQRVPAQATALRSFRQELNERDRRSRRILNGLRAGEEDILRVWALANNLK
jgi:hypothetical protein